MMNLTEALAAERERREQTHKEEVLRRKMGREVLRRLGECLSVAALPDWHFIANDDEIVVVHDKDGLIGAWTVDKESRLAFGSERTEWITGESWARVIDEAVMITAQVILDHEAAGQRS